RCALTQQRSGVRQAQLAHEILHVYRPPEVAMEVRSLCEQVFLRTYDDNGLEPLRKCVETVPLFPRPLRLAAEMDRDRARRQVKAPSRCHCKRFRHIALPAHVARNSLDAAAVALRQPARVIEHKRLARSD